MNITIKDIVGIGIGPFNLGLAALTAHQPKLDTEFIERRDGFNWHSGMLLPGATYRFLFGGPGHYGRSYSSVELFKLPQTT